MVQLNITSEVTEQHVEEKIKYLYFHIPPNVKIMQHVSNFLEKSPVQVVSVCIGSRSGWHAFPDVLVFDKAFSAVPTRSSEFFFEAMPLCSQCVT